MGDGSDQGVLRPSGTSLLPRDLTEEDFAAAPVHESLDDLLIEDLTDDEDESFIEAIAGR